MVKVKDYITLTRTEVIWLPKDKPYCEWCLHCKWSHGIKQAYCDKTSDKLPDYKTSIGINCPYKKIESEKDNE